MEEFLRLYLKFAHRRGSSIETGRSLIRLYFIVPFSAGLFGFAVFLFFEILFDFAADLLGLAPHLQISPYQIAIAALGFALQFVFQLFKNIK